MRKDHAWSDGFIARRFGRSMALGGSLVALMFMARSSAQEVPPPDYVAPESEDLDGDATKDTILAAPSGENQQNPAPGEVYVVSGQDGSVLVTLKGKTADDWFGYSVAVAGDLNNNGFKDLIIGAPKEDDGWAYAFYGPFRDTGPLVITAANADMAFNSPDPDDYDFGDAVGPVSDLTSDGIPELRIRAWFLDAGGTGTAHTYILSGATGEALFRVTGDDPFDPWEVVIGDADGDGDVDQDDLGIILANQGLTGTELTIFDGDINGDGTVDMTDYAIADGNFGFNAFAGLLGAVSYCQPITECLMDCDGIIVFLPGNIDPECRPFLCPQDSACAYTILPLPQPFPGTTNVVEWEVEVTIIVYPHTGESATWNVLEGAELIQVLEITGTTFRFRTIEFGPVLINASYFRCHEFCSLVIPINITWIDSDSDGLPDSWEEMMGLDPNNRDTDGDGILDGDEDYDGDGLSNHDEWIHGTDPMNPDTDGDGVSDGDEVAQGSDPNDPSDGGQPPDPEDLITVTLVVGDHSGSHSELWLLRVGDIRFKAPGHGEVTDPTDFQFLRGNSYPIKLIHLGSTVSPPDYDYTASVTPQAGEGACAVVDDPPQPVNPLLGEYEMTVACPQDGHPPQCNPAAGKTATLLLPKAKITEINGLYKEDGTYQEGYISDDNKGRIFSNRIYNPDNPAQTTWTRNKQYVEITVEVQGAADEIPNDAKIVWEVEDPDDPSNNAPAHPTAGQLLDPNDYDGVDNDGDGAADNNDGNDNTGSRDGAAVWEQIHVDYPLSGGNMTGIKDGVSKVRLNVTDDGGDNFTVEAKLKLNPAQAPCEGGAETGIMTVWKLIQLENTKMATANALPFGQLNTHFDKAFLVWDVQATESVPDQDPMGPNEAAAYPAIAAYVEAPPTGHFDHAGDGGWYFMASALNYVPDSGMEPETLVNYGTDGDSTVLQDGGVGDYAGRIQLPIAIPPDKEVSSIRIYNDDGSSRLTLEAEVHSDQHRDWLNVTAPNYHPSEDNPNTDDYKDLADHGFTAGSTIHVTARSPGSLIVTGISPADFQQGNLYFQGRTVVFSAGGLRTMVHELTHGLGMAHICGNQDYTNNLTCVMHYGHLWVQDASGGLMPWTAGNGGLGLCAPHIAFVRTANLEHDQTPPGWRILGW